jgi:hypothetical protein
LLIISQIPVADARRFVPSATHMLRAPSWPNARERREFVRGFGEVKPRLRGGLGPWVGEEVFCDARRAMRFPRGEGFWRLSAGGYPAERFRWAYRRFHSDGYGVSRVEYGLYDRPRVWPGARGLTALAEACMSESLEVRGVDRVWQRRSLLGAGEMLASALLRSSTEIVAGFDPDVRWLMPGRSLTLIVYECLVGDHTPGRGVPALRAYGIDLSYKLVEHGGCYGGVWFLTSATGVDSTIVRDLRIHLLRLHAERECLKHILRAIANGVIEIVRGDPATEDLQRYLNEAFTRIFKPSYRGPARDEILRTAYESDELISSGDRASLLSNLEKVRGNILRKVAERTDPTYFL